MVHHSDNVSVNSSTISCIRWGVFLAFCSLRLNLLDLNDNAPGKIEKLNGMLTRLNFFSVCYDILELYNLSFSSWK
jgi:hypothetical protein